MQPPKPHLQNLSYLIKERERVSLLGCFVSGLQNQPIINAVINGDPMLYIETASESVQLLAQPRALWFHTSGMDRERDEATLQRRRFLKTTPLEIRLILSHCSQRKSYLSISCDST
ncbi:unnamed protein product [Musa banksii]